MHLSKTNKIWMDSTANENILKIMRKLKDTQIPVLFKLAVILGLNYLLLKIQFFEILHVIFPVVICQ